MYLARTALIAITLFLAFSCQREIDFTPEPPILPPAIKTLIILSFSPDSAQVGDEVTLIGRNFDTSLLKNQVGINGTSATVLQVTDSAIRFKVPHNTTTGKIILTSGGRSATTTTDLIIFAVPWVRKADFPTSTSNGFSTFGPMMTFSSDKAGYIFRSNRLWKYDPNTNAWSEAAKLPSSKLHNFGMHFSIGNKAYLGLGAPEGGGPSTSLSQEVWEYNMNLDSWTRKADFPGPPRTTSFSFAIENFGYVGGGDTTTYGQGPTKDFWRYTPQTNSWVRLPDYPGSKVMGSLGFSVQKTGYVFEGGYGSIVAIITSFPSFNLWSFNPETNTWQQKASLPMAPGKSATSATVFSLNNFGYVAVGPTDTTNVNGDLQKRDFWQYDPGTDKWNSNPQVGGPVRWFPLSFAINKKGYVGLGTGTRADQRLDDLWEYTPE